VCDWPTAYVINVGGDEGAGRGGKGDGKKNPASARAPPRSSVTARTGMSGARGGGGGRQRRDRKNMKCKKTK